MQWIKLYVSMFSNRKIQLLLSRRDGDMFFRVWIQLLTLAGQSVDNGKIMRSETVPMTVEELAKIMHKKVDKMKSILDNLIHLEMIKYEDNTYIIKNWNEYQSADKYVAQRNELRKQLESIKDEETKIIQEQAPLEAELSNLVKAVEDAKNKVVELQDFTTKMILVAPKNESKIHKYQQEIEKAAFACIKSRVQFYDYDFVEKLYENQIVANQYSNFLK